MKEKDKKHLKILSTTASHEGSIALTALTCAITYTPNSHSFYATRYPHRIPFFFFGLSAYSGRCRLEVGLQLPLLLARLFQASTNMLNVLRP